MYRLAHRSFLVVAALACVSCSNDSGATFTDGGAADSGVATDRGPGAECTEGAKSCDGDEELHCRNGAWVSVQRCMAPESCIDLVGCAECNPVLANTCVDGDVYRCNGDGTVGELVERCLTEPCAGGQCGQLNCSAETQLIYVVDRDYRLLSFSPQNDAHTFSEIGTIRCPAGEPWPDWAGSTATPFSMSVDRQGRAWVLFTSGEIFWVDTKNAQCEATTFQKAQSGFELFGMGFVADAPGGSAETLFVFGGRSEQLTSGQLGRIDDNTLSLSPVGPLDLPGQSPELTGTGNAKLFGFFPGTDAFVGEIDKQTGQINQRWPINELTGNVTAWAFAHWGGRFYIFATSETVLSENSQVLRLDPKNGQVDVLLQHLPYQIVGAGVSTCAPVVN